MPENTANKRSGNGERADGCGRQLGACRDRVHAIPPCAEPGVARIVQSYVRKNSVAVDQLASLITTVHRALRGVGTAPSPIAEVLTPAVPIRRSVQQDHVVCLECGFRAQILRRHLRGNRPPRAVLPSLS
jgi:hypothetical protein